MVNVAVGIDHRDDRFFTAVFIVEIHADFGGFCRDQRVNDGDPLFTLNNRHIGEIEVADLVDPVGHFKQTADVDQLRLAPQTRVHRLRRFFPFFNEGILARIPDDIALFAFNDFRRQGGNKAFMRIGEIGVIREGELIVEGIVRFFGRFGRLFG